MTAKFSRFASAAIVTEINRSVGANAADDGNGLRATDVCKARGRVTAHGARDGRECVGRELCPEVLMQALLASIIGHVAEMGVFFAATAALTAGALALR